MLRIAIALCSVLGLAVLFIIVDGALELNDRIDRCADGSSPAFITDDSERAAACDTPGR